jgi:hypothetical protein
MLLYASLIKDTILYYIIGVEFQRYGGQTEEIEGGQGAGRWVASATSVSLLLHMLAHWRKLDDGAQIMQRSRAQVVIGTVRIERAPGCSRCRARASTRYSPRKESRC